MWSSTNQRIKALMGARAREKDRLSRPIHVLRADVVLRVQGENEEIPIHGRALLNDFSLNGITLYALSALPPNVDLVLELNHPREFRILGRVIWCQYQPSHSHVITRESFRYRLGIAFKFQNAEEEAAFKDFCEEMVHAYSQNGHLKILGDPTQRPSPSITGNFTPDHLPPITGTTAAHDATPSVTSGAPSDAEAHALLDSVEPGTTAAKLADEAEAEEDSVSDVLSQLGVEVPVEEKKAA